jgi:hypothetical protein
MAEMYQGIPKPTDRADPRTPFPSPPQRFDAALDVLWVAPKTRH